MTALVLDLAVNPVPLERARTVTSTRFGNTSTRSFTPEKSKAFKDEFQWAARAAGARGAPTAARVSVGLQFWRHHRGAHCGDLDNLVKAVLDAGNQFLWVDDRQVRHLDARIVDDGPTVTGRIVLTVEELNPAQLAGVPA